MANVHMRNKATGEIKDVQLDSSEFRQLQRQVTAAGLPLWEQTSYVHAEAIKERAKYGELLEEDLGHDAQDELRYEALRLNDEGVAPEANPHLFLTPGEVEAGLTPDQKLKDLQDQYNTRRLGVRQRIFGDSADAIADEREDRPQVGPLGATPQTARSGGSDDRLEPDGGAQGDGEGDGEPAGATAGGE